MTEHGIKFMCSVDSLKKLTTKANIKKGCVVKSYQQVCKEILSLLEDLDASLENISEAGVQNEEQEQTDRVDDEQTTAKPLKG